MHGSNNLAIFNATTYAQSISEEEYMTQEWLYVLAPVDDEEGWEEYYSKSAELGMSPLSVIYSKKV